MALQIDIDNITINTWSVNIEAQVVEINYSLMSLDTIWRREKARFWVTMPAEPQEGYDFQLPIAYAQNLLDLTTDAISVLKNHWGIT